MIRCDLESSDNRERMGEVKAVSFKTLFLSIFFLLIATAACADPPQSASSERWVDQPQSTWPHIAMINQIEYVDNTHPVAGCSFLLDTGQDTLAATAKHILMFFKSEEMASVSFEGTLESWRMFPKDSPEDVVVVDSLINEDPDEPIDHVPTERDWLLFTIKEKSESIQPLRFRTTPMEQGEKIFIVGWRYSDKDCPQVIYEGNYVQSEDGAVIISTEVLADNTIPGLSGSPVIDSNGDVIGLMSQKYEKMEKLASTEYPRRVLMER